MNVDIYIVNAFSKNNTGGNAAGVAITSVKLTQQQKINIASKLGFSETVFVSKSKKADFKLEYFTPKGEVPLCGHATIGAFVVLSKLNIIKKLNNKIETRLAILNIRIEENGTIFMEQNLPQYFEILDKYNIEQCFDNFKIDNRFPIQIVSTGLKDILVPIESASSLESMIANSYEISKASEEMKCIGIHAFSLIDTDELTAICRNFAPLYGIEEESATGTSNCALACYLFKYGLKKDEYIFEQGHNLNSVSKISVRLESCDEVVTKVLVGGDGYLVDKVGIEMSETR